MKQKVDMKNNIRDYEHYDKQRLPKELEDHIDSRYDGESDLMKSLMSQAIYKFDIKTFYELAITNESLWSINDWPEGEGFGSSDHNFAIRDLMSAVGYEFDDQDTSGRFVVTKQPEEIEKAGITNVRMSKDDRIDRGMAKQKADAETNPNWGKDVGPVDTQESLKESRTKIVEAIKTKADGHAQNIAGVEDEIERITQLANYQ